MSSVPIPPAPVDRSSRRLSPEWNSLRVWADGRFTETACRVHTELTLRALHGPLGAVTLGELADRLDVDTKAIRRGLQQLLEAGVIVEGEAP